MAGGVFMYQNISPFFMRQLLLRKPQAKAAVRGSADYPDIRGEVDFVQSPVGVLVTAQINGLPKGRRQCDAPIFAMHIHQGTACSGTADMPFGDALGHFDTDNCPHPYHAGDLPPLFSTDGFAWCSFLTGRFTLDSVIGRTIIIHSRPDDFTTQPSGNPGSMISCGVIRRV